MSPEPPAPPDRRRTIVATAFFTAVFLGSFGGLLYLFSGFVTDFILAFMFTSLFRPAYAWVLPRVKERKAVASGLVTALVAITLAIPLAFLITSLSVEAASFYENTISRITLDQVNETLFGEGWLPENARRAADLAGFEWSPANVKATLVKISGAVATFLSGQVNQLLSNVLSATFHFAIMLLIIFYMLVDGDRLLKFFYDTSPLPEAEEALLVKTFGNVARAALVGNGIGSAIQGIIGGISMAAVGLSSPILWGTVMTIFAFLPLVGISVVTIPATVVLLLSGNYVTAILFFGFNAVQALFVENVIKTRLIGSHMSMHNLLIFLSIIGGIATFGILGLLYGPLIVALFLTLTELYHQHYKGEILGPDTTS